ncbi:MAG: hypothetical protein J5854_02175 [Clostridia bacterium]|nr:hypothetical protein [Clostridia bacterium]
MKKLISAILVFAVLLAVSACVYDGPPKDDGTPEPDAHNGAFVCEHGSMVFAGDGKNVVVDFDEGLSAITGLPAGEHEASYAFMANTPPHRYEYRWDKSNEFVLTVDGVSYTFGNYMGRTSADTVAIYAYPAEGGVLDLIFEKKGS